MKYPLFAATAVIALAGLGLIMTASPSYAGSKNETSTETVIMKKSEHRNIVVKVGDGETIKLSGVKGARKIELREADGVQKLKAWDKDGKLIADKSYAKGDDPLASLFIVDKDGKEKSLEMPSIPDAPEPPSPPDADGAVRKVVVMTHNGGGEHKILCTDGDKVVEVETEKNSDGDRVVRKKVICIATEDAKPETRVKALEKAIKEVETDALLAPDEQTEILEDLRNALVEAKADARK
jgi:hypothetical protein